MPDSANGHPGIDQPCGYFCSGKPQFPQPAPTFLGPCATAVNSIIDKSRLNFI